MEALCRESHSLPCVAEVPRSLGGYWSPTLGGQDQGDFCVKGHFPKQQPSQDQPAGSTVGLWQCSD